MGFTKGVPIVEPAFPKKKTTELPPWAPVAANWSALEIRCSHRFAVPWIFGAKNVPFGSGSHMGMVEISQKLW